MWYSIDLPAGPLGLGALLLVMMGGSPLAADAVEDAPTEAFEDLVADYQEWREANDVIGAGRRGDLQAAARWPDASPEAVDGRNRTQAGFLQRLKEIDSKALDARHRSNYAVLDYLLRTEVELSAFDEQRVPFVNDSGFFTTPLSVASATRPRTVEEAEAWLARLRALPAWLIAHRAWLDRGIKDGFTQPAYVVDQVIRQLESIAGTEPANSPLMQPFSNLSTRMDEQVRADLRRRGLEQVEEVVLPAYADLLKYFRQTYRPAARESLGISEAPNGRDYYRALVRQHTTLNTTPEQVHQRGLAEVKRIRADMEAVVAETGFEGSFAEFLEFLRTDPKFYASTPTELLKHAAWIAKRADDQMPRFFGRLPRLPYGVRPVPEHMAPTYTTGRYWPGDLDNGIAGGYMVNTYALDQRPLYTLPALTLHEAVPGHHHQGALARELEDVPRFRQRSYITAFGEGWALYTEYLGIEMGIYTTPYEHFGRLSYEMWRACRLVVDTGIHFFGWSRERAEACLLENSALAPHNVRTEVARYISWPGQALAYKTGELLIRDLRTRAERELGEAFDLRAFHDHLLAEGALPLSALEQRMVEWIAANSKP